MRIIIENNVDITIDIFTKIISDMLRQEKGTIIYTLPLSGKHIVSSINRLKSGTLKIKIDYIRRTKV